MSRSRRRFRVAWEAHVPEPDPQRDPDRPSREDEPVPPDAEPIVPQRDPPSPEEPGAPVKADD